MKRKRFKEALTILNAVGMLKAQQNERSALSLLSLVNLGPGASWTEAQNPLMGITPIIAWMKAKYSKKYQPNTRETIRRQTLHQFVAAGIAVYNPDDPSRPVNSPNAVYQISASALQAIRTYGTPAWDDSLQRFLDEQPKLVEQYAKLREMRKVHVLAKSGKIVLSPGKHSQLIKAVIEDFGGYYVPEGQLVYAGDTGLKHGYWDEALFGRLGILLDEHGKMPDVILYCPVRNWLLLIEAVTSHGPVDGKRHQELQELFKHVRAGLVYVTAFVSRAIMSRYLGSISWETEVWVAEAPTHLIHFNGSRFLGPYTTTDSSKD